MAVDGVDGSSAPVQQPEQTQTDDSAQAPSSTAASDATPSAAQAQPDQTPSAQDGYEAPRARGPVDLSGAPRYEPYDSSASNATTSSATQAVGDATASPATGAANDSTAAGSSEPDRPVRLLSASAAERVQPTNAVDRPETAADPSKIGVVLNDQPENLPTGGDLDRLGVTSARISLSADNFRPDDKDNVAHWKNALDDYRNSGIDVTLNLPRELEGSNSYPEPDEKKLNQDGSWSPSDQQSQGWTNAFNDWKENQYLPAVQNVIDKIGTVEGEDGVRQSRVKGYEVLNEPDERHNTGYAPGLPPQQFGEVLRDVYQKVNGPDADPNAPREGQPRIVAGGLDSGDPSYLDRAMVDGKLYADTIGVHPYAKRPDSSYDPNAGEGTWHGTFQEVSQAYGRFGKPLTFTEVGDERGYGENVHPGEESRLYPGAAAAAASHLDNVDHAYVFWKDPYNGRFGITDPVHEDPQNPGSRIVGYQWRPHADDLHQRLQQWNARPTP